MDDQLRTLNIKLALEIEPNSLFFSKALQMFSRGSKFYFEGY